MSRILSTLQKGRVTWGIRLCVSLFRKKCLYLVKEVEICRLDEKKPNILKVMEKLWTTWKFYLTKEDQFLLWMCSNSIFDFKYTWLGHCQLQSAAFLWWKSHLRDFLRDKSKCSLLIISSHGLTYFLLNVGQRKLLSSCSSQTPRESSLIAFMRPFNHNAVLLTDSQVHLQILQVTSPYPPPWGHIIHFMCF